MKALYIRCDRLFSEGGAVVYCELRCGQYLLLGSKVD